MIPKQIIKNFTPDGVLFNTTIIEWLDEKHQSDARNATESDLEQIEGLDIAGYVARISELETELSDLKRSIVNGQFNQSPSLISNLGAAFDKLPDEIKDNPIFIQAFGTVRILLDAGRKDLAIKFVASLTQAPQEIRDNILSILNQ